MPQVTITYKNPETLKKLKKFAKEFDFQISTDENDIQENKLSANFIPGDKTLSLEALHEVFTGKDIDAEELRRTAWKR